MHNGSATLLALVSCRVWAYSKQSIKSITSDLACPTIPPQEEDKEALDDKPVEGVCELVQDVVDVIETAIAVTGSEEEAGAFIEACEGLTEVRGGVLTLRGLTREALLPVTAVCVPGTGICQITGVDGDMEQVLQNVVHKRLRELGQEQPANLRVDITAGGAIQDAATNGPLDLLMAVGDSTSRTATHELELLARGALERTVLTPLTNDTHHVILADVVGDRITPVKLGCYRQFTPGNTFHVNVMLPGLKGLKNINIICHPDTARLLSGHSTTTSITSITRLEELPIALGVRQGDIQEALPLPVARPLPGLPSHHMPDPLVGCHFDVDTVSKRST